MRQRIDGDRRRDVVDAARAGERVEPVDVHRAGAADAFAAGAAESQRRIDLGFDPDERVEHHRPAIVAIDEIGVDARIGVVVRVPAIDAELGHPAWRRPASARSCHASDGSFGKRQLNHWRQFLSGAQIGAKRSVNPRLRLDIGDVVAHRVGVHRAVVDRRPSASTGRSRPACASSSSRRRAWDSPRAHARRGFPARLAAPSIVTTACTIRLSYSSVSMRSEFQISERSVTPTSAPARQAA